MAVNYGKIVVGNGQLPIECHRIIQTSANNIL